MNAKPQGSGPLPHVPTELLIGGEWVPASDDGRFPVTDPASGETIAEVANATVADARLALDAAEAAAATWRDYPPRERAELLRAAFELMRQREEDLTELIVRENGKAWDDALAEVRYAAEFFRWYAEEAVRMLGETSRAPAGTNMILTLRQPIGISLLITPWNFPAAMATRKLGPALAAGCTTLLKPASDTPLTALAIGDILTEVGVPAGVVNVLPSRRSNELSAALLGDPRVRKLSFTGSTEVGRDLLRKAAENVVSCSMELGGNAPVIVCADADLAVAVEGTMVAKMRNGGEACTAANRIYVHTDVAEEFTRRLSSAMAALPMGPGMDRSNRLGPLINPTARRKVTDLVGDAVRRGAALATDTRPDAASGNFYPPTVLAGVDPDADIMHTEVFGPVAPIATFSTDEEAIALANSTELGLASYVFGELGHALRLAEHIEAGMVAINRGLLSDPAAPFGGVKQSGLGREGAHDGLLEFTETKYIAVDW